jgi:hypothetical protein
MKIFKHFGGTNPIPDQKRKKEKVWKILKEMYTMVYDEVHNCKKTGERGCLGGHRYWFRTLIKVVP